MSEGLFKNLKEKALGRTDLGYEFADGVDAIIETLQKMMVGEPKEAKIQHGLDPGIGNFTEVSIDEGHGGCVLFDDGHHGADGQKVMVFVVGVEEKDA